jgi:SAM-dependent methyltransferase
VLDLGCGAGRFLRALREAGADPVGVELAQHAVDRARQNVPGADIRLLAEDGSIPLGHGEVDLIWCSEVLEHMADVGHALLEMRRVLRRGGRALLTVPHHSRLTGAALALTRFEQHFDPLGQHLRFFTRRSLTTALNHAGFDPITVRARLPLLVARASRR